MSNEEDQNDEIDAIEAIFETDATVHSRSPPSFDILLEPCPGEGDEENHVRVLLKVKLPADYPDCSPELTLQAERGLNEKKMKTLNAIAQAAAEDGLGEVSIFTITEALKEWLADNNEKEKTMHEEMLARQNAKEEDEKGDDGDGSGEEEEEEEEEGRETNWDEDGLAERQKHFKNPLNISYDALVTTESFAQWKIDFENERKQKEEAEMKASGIVVKVEEVETKTTGRQLFQQNLAKTLENSKAGGPTGKPGDTEEVFWFNEAIYDDDDVDDISDSDEEQ